MKAGNLVAKFNQWYLIIEGIENQTKHSRCKEKCDERTRTICQINGSVFFAYDFKFKRIDCYRATYFDDLVQVVICK